MDTSVFGTGFYSRKLLEWGARSVVGVDISQNMVATAAKTLHGTRYGEHARFVQGDGSVLSSTAPLVETTIAMWLRKGSILSLEYGFSTMRGMRNSFAPCFETIARNLNPQGIFVGLCLYPTDNLRTYADVANSSAWGYTGVQYMYDEVEMDHGQGYGLRVIAAPATAPASAEGVEFECFHLKKSLYEEEAQLAAVEVTDWQSCKFPDGDWRKRIGLDGDEQGWRSLHQFPHVSVTLLRKL